MSDIVRGIGLDHRQISFPVRKKNNYFLAANLTDMMQISFPVKQTILSWRLKPDRHDGVEAVVASILVNSRW